MGVRPAGVLRLGRRRFEPWQLLVTCTPGLPRIIAKPLKPSWTNANRVSTAGSSALLAGVDVESAPLVPRWVRVSRMAWWLLTVRFRNAHLVLHVRIVTS
jgi:hypothetical protein